ncbi:MAG TPA: ABC transporter permease, partial [bacterium]|nr:ABC transporter permease [bacterium]
MARLKHANRVSYLSLWILAVLYALAILADCLAPYPYELQNRQYALCPPTVPSVIK